MRVSKKLLNVILSSAKETSNENVLKKYALSKNFMKFTTISLHRLRNYQNSKHASKLTHILTLEPRPPRVIWENVFTEKILVISHFVKESQMGTMLILWILRDSFNVTKMVRPLIINVEPASYGTTIAASVTGHKGSSVCWPKIRIFGI